MPDLPRILSRPDLPTVALPRVSAAAAGAPFTELAQAAAQWQHALEKKAPVDAALESSEYNIAAEQWKNDVMVQRNEDGTLSPSDPATWVPAFRAKEKEERAARLANIKDPRVAAFLNTHANKTLDEHIKELNKRAVETVHGQTAAKAQTTMENSAQLAASTDNPVLKQMARDNFEALIKTAEAPTRIGNQVFPPAFVKGEGAKLREKFNEEEQKRTVYFKLDNQPRQLLEDLKNPTNFAYLTGPEREAVRSHANARINEQKQLTKEAKQEVKDDRYRYYFEKLEKGDTNFVNEVRTDKAMDHTDIKFWDEKLHDRVRERARDNRELDPYEKSDGATRAYVQQQVWANPKAWPPDRIYAYSGKGLSNTHAHQLAEDQKQLTHDPDNALKKYDPLNRAMATLDGLRRQYMFTKEGQEGAAKGWLGTGYGERVKPTDANASAALRLKNDEEYGKVADRVRAAQAAGEDPQKALEREMKPYFVDKTTHYFENMMNFFSQPRTPTDVGAGETPEAAKLRQQRDKDRQALDTSIEGLRKAQERAQNPTYAPTKGPEFVTTPDDAARQFLMDNNLLITPATIEKTKAYLAKKKAGQ